MQSQIHGIAVVGNLEWRIWEDVAADVWQIDCAVNAHGYYVSPDPRLFVVLDLGPGVSFELTQTDTKEKGRHDTPGSMSFIPAHVPVEGKALGVGRIRHLDIHFAEAAVTRRFGRALDRDSLLQTRLQFLDPELVSLAGMIADECTSPHASHDLLGDGLINACLAKLFDVRRDEKRRRPGLSRQQLKLVTDFIEQHCLEPIRLGELAAMVNLSETYFSHAFKSSTGLPPHRWQMQARLRRVQEWLVEGNWSMTQIASMAGFADQAHFARVFKLSVGLTPTEWRRGMHDGSA
jgi:AraC-like DNA-binding protein